MTPAAAEHPARRRVRWCAIGRASGRYHPSHDSSGAKPSTPRGGVLKPSPTRDDRSGVVRTVARSGLRLP